MSDNIHTLNLTIILLAIYNNVNYLIEIKKTHANNLLNIIKNLIVYFFFLII